MNFAKHPLFARSWVVGIVLALCWSASPLGATNDGPRSGQPLDGTWVLTLSLEPNPVLPETVVLLSSFTRDGGFLSSSDLPPIPVLLAEPIPPEFNPFLPFDFPFLRLGHGHGSWERLPGGRYQLETWRLALWNDPDDQIPFAPDGSLFGFARGRATVWVDHKAGHLQGEIVLELLAPDLSPVAPPASGTLEGVRVGPGLVE